MTSAASLGVLLAVSLLATAGSVDPEAYMDAVSAGDALARFV